MKSPGSTLAFGHTANYPSPSPRSTWLTQAPRSIDTMTKAQMLMSRSHLPGRADTDQSSGAHPMASMQLFLIPYNRRCFECIGGLLTSGIAFWTKNMIAASVQRCRQAKLPTPKRIGGLLASDDAQFLRYPILRPHT